MPEVYVAKHGGQLVNLHLAILWMNVTPAEAF